MSVDDMSVGSLDVKGIEDTVAYLLVVTQFEVIAFLFFIYLLVCEEISFECRHFRLVEQRTVLATPQI